MSQMAPFRGGRSHRGSAGRASFRSTSRGAYRARGRGGSRGRHFATNEANTNPQNVPDNVVDAGDTTSQLSENEIQLDQLENLSESEEDDTPAQQQPYSALLQALSNNIQRGEPQKKKRKLETVQHTASEDLVHGIDSATPDVANDGLIAHTLDDVDETTEMTGSAASVTSEDDESTDDPFEIHLSDSTLNNLLASMPKDGRLPWQKRSNRSPSGWKYVSASPAFVAASGQSLLPAVKKIADLHLKQKLQRGTPDQLPDLSAVDGHLAGLIFNHKDVMFCDRSTANATQIRRAYCLHVLNHVLKTRDRVLKNNAKLVKQGDDDAELEFRDQGFTRPKVLFLLPTRQACAHVAEIMVNILQPEQQENRKRFQDSFSAPDDLVGSDKPNDFKELFAGNDDDRFMIGIKLTRKSIKYFASFYTSDIIFASPLGLHTKITSEDKKKRDWDYLSSIEILVADQVDAMLMQNWEHVETVFEHLNLEPKQSHGCDFARVRRWYLDKCAKYYRQNLIISAYSTPELNGLFERHMSNIAGKYKLSKCDYDGAIVRLGLQVKQTFARFDVSSAAADPDARFRYFTTSVLPVLTKYARAGSGKLQGTLVFIPSYMDFLRVQNFFTYSNDSQSITFDPYDLPCVSEYASPQQNARARSLFQSGKHSILLYTGRAHHFHRYKLKGVKRVIMYSLPENPVFYEELVGGYLGRSVSEGIYTPDEVSVQSIFSRYDALKLERVVGTKRLMPMLKEKGDIFEFS